MELLEQARLAAVAGLPLLATVAVVVVVLIVSDRVLRARRQHAGKLLVPGQVIMLLLTAVGLVLVILAMPVSETTRGQLMGLVGLVLTAVIGLSSTTFVTNAMAGMMLRAVRSFRPGDFVRVGGQFGRVTELGLFHTEIQTEDRDLTTIPNLHLVTNPVTVVRASGTIVSANVTLGYDVGHQQVEPLLAQAALLAGLEEPFVQVTKLGDFAVTYRIAGFLPEVKQLLSTRSTLRKMVLDTLHEHDIEIMSPTIMGQRPMPPNEPVVPNPDERAGATVPWPRSSSPESMIFDKAEEAERLEALRDELTRLGGEIKTIEADRATASDARLAALDRELTDRRARVEQIERVLDAADDTRD